MVVIKNILILTLLFIIKSNSVYAIDLKQGEIFQGNINNIYNTNVTISLPPGKWLATNVKKDGSYSYIDFENKQDNAYFYLTIPNTIIAGDYFRSSGVKKCKSKNENGDKYSVHATDLVRGGLQVSYCIQNVIFSDGNSWLNIMLHAQKSKGNPLMDAYYNVYYDEKYSNIKSLDKRQLDEIGKSLIRTMKNNIGGKPGDYRMASQLVDYSNSSTQVTSSVSNSSSSSKLKSLSDKEICLRATTTNGLGWEMVGSKFGDYVKEAFRRNIALSECRKLTDRFPKSDISDGNSSIKDKLKELKVLLDDGLISQELYDIKSAKLLEDF